jgi:hypothetical protein
MAKSAVQKRNPEGTPNRKKKSQQINWRQYFIVGALVLALVALLLPGIIKIFSSGAPTPPLTSQSNPSNMPEPKFTKEGELSFISSETGQPIAKIDIEKADNDMERGFGLMYRRSMSDTQGMLFLFNESEPQSFWMRNTFIPLDIMFVDENLTITTIHENTQPLSDKSIPSNGNARYVVEVNGGFTKKHGLKIGDKINWK